MRAPQASQEIEQALKTSLKAELRPYQAQGAGWLNMLNQMRLGAILADDMGLGKPSRCFLFFCLRRVSQEAW